MEGNNFKDGWEASSDQENVSGFDHNAIASNFVRQVQPTNILKVVMASFNIILSCAVIGVSVTQLMRPFWISAMLSIVASLSLMLTAFYLYIAFIRKDNSKDILRRALKRVMRFKN